MAYGHLSPEASRPKFPAYLVVAALAPPLHQPALPHCPLVSCSFLSTLEPCCWRRALPWARVGLSGLGGYVSLRAPSSILCKAMGGQGHWSGLTSTPLAWLPCGETAGTGAEVGGVPWAPPSCPCCLLMDSLVSSLPSAQAGAATEAPGSPAGLPASQLTRAPGSSAA